MSHGRNSRTERYKENFPKISLTESDIGERCKFNFSYFDYSQEPATNIMEWDERNLQDLFGKLKEYSKSPLSHWAKQRIGSKRNHILEVYGAFPSESRTDFSYPSHVPGEVDWARFRIDSSKRLIGFLIPKGYCSNDNQFDNNTFYVVFLDLHHKFYKTK